MNKLINCAINQTTLPLIDNHVKCINFIFMFLIN